MRAIEFGAGGQVELAAELLDLGLYRLTQTHLARHHLGIGTAERRRERGVRVRILGGVDPQIEERTGRLDRLGRVPLAQAPFEVCERILRRLLQQALERLLAALVIGERMRESLPALLVLACEAERRQRVPWPAAVTGRAQQRCQPLHPGVPALEARTLETRQHLREGVGAGAAEHVPPGRRHGLGCRVLTGQATGELLHLFEPRAGLSVDAREQVVEASTRRARLLHPPVAHALPRIGRRGERARHAESRHARRRRPGHRALQGVLPRVPVLPRQTFEFRARRCRAVPTVSHHPLLPQSPDHNNSPRPRRMLRTWEYGASC